MVLIVCQYFPYYIIFLMSLVKSTQSEIAIGKGKYIEVYLFNLRVFTFIILVELHFNFFV